jgi:hypothetical protein
MDNAEERVGCFSASNISRLMAGGGGATRKSYILEVATEVVVGKRPQLDTAAMKHGIANQMNAYEFVLKPLYKGVQWVDKYIPINKNCGASPDCVWLGNYPIDIKCPFEIDTYLEQIEKVKPSYFAQIQMQILAVKGEEGALCTYLTKKEEWGSDTWLEYPFALEDRFRVELIKKDEETCDRILTAVEKAAPERDLYIECLNNATVMDETEYFYYQMKHNKCRDIKSCSNLEKANIIRVNDKFYYKIG